MKTKKGFTIVELIVVIAIIGILAAAALLSLAKQQAKARDTRRKADLTNINTSLQNYNSESYEPKTPSEYNGTDSGGWDYSSQTGGNVSSTSTFITFLSESGYMAEVPQDPINNGSGNVHSGGSGFAYAYDYFKDTSSEDLNGFTTYQLNANLETDETNLYSVRKPVRPR